MIFAAGLSPAWQQIMQFDSFQLGEVNRAQSVNWCASGKVLNVTMAASQLGAKTSLLSTAGGPAGDAIRNQFEKLEIHADWLEVTQPTRVCTTILDATGATTELVENTGPVDESILEDFLDRFRIHSQVADVTVLTGSIPGNATDDYYVRLIHNIPGKFILDFRGPGLLHCLPFSPFLIKPNREELAMTLGGEITSEDEVLSAMKHMNSQGAEWVVVSDGPHSLMATNRDDEAFRFTPPKVDVVNPIGCGDCLAAGIACSIGEGEGVVDAIRFGMGVAAQNAMDVLPARVDQHVSRELADQVIVEDIG